MDTLISRKEVKTVTRVAVGIPGHQHRLYCDWHSRQYTEKTEAYHTKLGGTKLRSYVDCATYFSVVTLVTPTPDIDIYISISIVVFSHI